MPQDNIKRAIQKGTGELPGTSYEEVVFEGYGPEGVAVYVEAMTDNKNRTLPEIRHLFTKYGGSLGEANCVGWMFDKKGSIVIEKAATSEEELFETAIESGAEDIRDDGDHFEILTPPDLFNQVVEALKGKKLPMLSNEIAMVPQSTIKLQGAAARKLLGMMEALEDHDDVQHVWANFHLDPSEFPE
jgi:YebC/PmpR family DNA-binding regulatory protein